MHIVVDGDVALPCRWRRNGWCGSRV